MEPGGAALVTGASRGIGRAVSLELCRRGFDVVATMRDPAAGAGLVDAAAGLSGTVEIRRLDVAEDAGVAAFAVPERLRVLVNNAAVDVENLALEDTPVQVWRRVFDVNVVGLADLTRRALPALRRAGADGGAVVVNVTSASVVVPVPFFTVYRASKAAVGALSDSLRLEVAPWGVRVLEVAPGPVDTEMFAASAAVPEAVASPPYRRLAELMGAVRAMDPSADPAPVAAAAAALVDAALDDDGPVRVSCDPVGDALLAPHAAAHERLQRAYLDVFRTEP